MCHHKFAVCLFFFCLAAVLVYFVSWFYSVALFGDAIDMLLKFNNALLFWFRRFSAKPMYFFECFPSKVLVSYFCFREFIDSFIFFWCLDERGWINVHAIIFGIVWGCTDSYWASFLHMWWSFRDVKDVFFEACFGMKWVKGVLFHFDQNRF